MSVPKDEPYDGTTRPNTLFTARVIPNPFVAAGRFLGAAGFRFGALAALRFGARALAFFGAALRRFAGDFAMLKFLLLSD